MMYLDTLQYILIVMFVVGFGLPLVNVILGALSSSGDVDVDVDVDLDVDIDLDVDLDVDIDLDLDIDTDLPDIEADTGIDTDAGDLKGARAGRSRDGIRFNMNCLCLAMVIFSALSYYRIQFVADTGTLLLVLGTDALIAFAAYAILYRLVIKRLKDNDASALRSNSLLHRRATVQVPIIGDGIGKIELKDALGAPITYLAKIDRDVSEDERIPIGKTVLVTEVDRENNICYVAVTHTKS